MCPLQTMRSTRLSPRDERKVAEVGTEMIKLCWANQRARRIPYRFGRTTLSQEGCRALKSPAMVELPRERFVRCTVKAVKSADWAVGDR